MTANAEHAQGRVSIQCQVIIGGSSSSNSIIQTFAPEIFDQYRRINLLNMDASKLEFEINNLYNINHIKDNRILIILKSGQSILARKWFDVYKADSMYRLNSPQLFSNWAMTYETVADGFDINFAPKPRIITAPSSFSVKGKYRSAPLFESPQVQFEGCERLPEFPVPDPGYYCER